MRTGDTLQLPVLSWTVWTTSAVYTSAETAWEDVPQDVQVLRYDHGDGYVTWAYGINDDDVYSMPGFGAEHDKTGAWMETAAFQALRATALAGV